MLAYVRKPLAKIVRIEMILKRNLCQAVVATRFQDPHRVPTREETKKRLLFSQNFHQIRQIKTSLLTFEDDKESKVMPERKLLDILTPEFQQKLAENKTSKKFKLKSIQEELKNLYSKDFPLPESLTDDQWNILMEFSSPDLRIYYLVQYYFHKFKLNHII